MKGKMLGRLDELAKIANKYGDLSADALKEIAELKEDMENFRAYVPFLGIFSVGKSSLLNDWLGEKLLPEDQGATTALATELLPGPKEEMVVVLENGRERPLSNLPSNEEDANTEDASNGLYAYCLSPSEKLREIFPIVPVDMPGINSGIKRHTEALMRYANKGAAFFLVFMPEEGTLPAPMKAFLQELVLGDRPVWMAITKCDTAPEDKIASVTETIAGQLRMSGIEPKGILHFSRLDGKTANSLQNAFFSLNVGELNARSHFDSAFRIGLRIRDQISALLDSQHLDSTELDRQIRICEKAAADIEEALGREEKKLSKRMANLPGQVGRDVMDALMANIDVLVSSLENGQEVFAARLAGIVNKVVNSSLEASLQKDFGEMASSLAGDLDLEEKAIIDPEKLRAGTEAATAALSGISKILKSTKSKGALYKIVTTSLAVTTSLVAPIIELLVIFLPDLLSLFVDKAEAKRERLRGQLSGKVFPAVQNSIETELRGMLPELEGELLNALRNEWRGRLEDSRKALEEAKAGKQKAADDYGKKAASFAADLDAVNNALHGLLGDVNNPSA